MDYDKHGEIGNDQDYVTRINTQVIQTCLTEVLVTGESITKITERLMTDKLVLFHKECLMTDRTPQSVRSVTSVP
jgi:hypothetical protein